MHEYKLVASKTFFQIQTFKSVRLALLPAADVVFNSISLLSLSSDIFIVT